MSIFDSSDYRHYERKRQALRKRAEQRWKRAPKTESATRTTMSYLSIRELRKYEEYGVKWYALKFGPDILPPSGNPKKLDEEGMPVPALKDTPGTWEYKAIRAVDTHTEVTYAYCQKGHLHEYYNGNLHIADVDSYFSKHYSRVRPLIVYGFGWKDKTVVPVEACGD